MSRSRISNRTVPCVCFVDSVGGIMEDMEVPRMGKSRESIQQNIKLGIFL